MSYGPQLAGQAELAEAGPGPAAAANQRGAFGGAGHGQGHRQICAGLVDADTAYHVDEHVGGAQADAPVTPQHGQHEGDPIAVQAGDHPPRGYQLRSADKRLDLNQEGAGALHGADHHRAGGLGRLRDKA